MKIILSPAKALDFETSAPTAEYSVPRFLEHSQILNDKLKTMSRKEIGTLMKISDALSDLNYTRNQSWELPFTAENAKQAVYSFTGQAYQGLDAMTIAEDKIPALQDKLRILSGLYGV